MVFAFEVVQRIQETFNKIGVRFLAAAVLLLVAALMLILNTIRVAMFARRREIEVMKLVGATNWFIRVPFIVEGIIQTLLGAAVAVGIMTFLIRPFIDELSEDRVLPIFQGFVITDSNLITTNLFVVLVAVAHRRHRLRRRGQPLPRRLTLDRVSAPGSGDGEGARRGSPRPP